MTGLVAVEELAIPGSLDDMRGADFQAIVGVRNAIIREYMGEVADTTSVDEFFAGMMDQTDERNRMFIARHNDVPIAYAMLFWSVEPDTRVSWLDVNVHPDHRSQGIGSALLDRLEAIGRDAGRPVAQGGGKHRPWHPGPVLASPTGFGELPREDPVVRFMLNRGYALEQVYRVSHLHLPVPAADLDAQLAVAWGKAGEDYRIVTWAGSTPERWLDDVAVVMNRMSTDAPSANFEVEEEPWDAERVRRRDERRSASGRTTHVAAVEHIPGGRLVAYSDLSVSGDRTRPAHQGDTLVLAEHRGRRLGMVVKLANIRQLQEFGPEIPYIATNNAEENRPMLDVNEAVGFVSISCIGAWKKTFA
jgi:GNAT superfamily N-acetyltransferase